MLLWLLMATISVAQCKKTFVAGSASHFVGRAAWQDDAQQTIVASTEDRTVGRSILTCNAKLPPGSTSAVLEFGGARIAFDGPSEKAGLEITATPGKCTISGLRIHGEKWIELGPAAYELRFTTPVDRVTVVFTLIDSSIDSAVRADINPVEIRAAKPGEALPPCPPAVR